MCRTWINVTGLFKGFSVLATSPFRRISGLNNKKPGSNDNMFTVRIVHAQLAAVTQRRPRRLQGESFGGECDRSILRRLASSHNSCLTAGKGGDPRGRELSANVTHTPTHTVYIKMWDTDSNMSQASKLFMKTKIQTMVRKQWKCVACFNFSP